MRFTFASFLVILAAGAVAGVGCQETACNSDEDCPTGRSCVDQRCTEGEISSSSSGGVSSSSQESSSHAPHTSSSKVSSSSRHSSSRYTSSSSASSVESSSEESSSSAASSSSSVESSSSSAAVTSSSFSGAPETCDNGVDDNGDSLVDCADPRCGDFRCIPAAPNGWTGPYEITEVEETAESPACEPLFAGTPYEGHADPNFTAAHCACRCGSPEGATCPRPTVHAFSDNTCATECNTVTFDHDDVPCVESSCAATAMKVEPARVVGGSCAPIADPPTLDPWAWQVKARACPVPTVLEGGCGTDQVCSPRAGFPFETVLCIRQDGVAACPAGDFSDQRVYYGAGQDGRECNTCTCGAPQGNCQGSVFTGISTCVLNQLTQRSVATSMACTQVGGSNNFLYKASTVASGFCTPHGTPGGAVTGDDATAVTFCCTTF